MADLERVMTSTSVEILASISIESTFNELDTEWLELVYEVVDGSSVIAKCQQD